MDNLIFYNDTFFGKELAFIFNIKYRFITDLSPKTVKKDLVFVFDNEEKIATKNGLIRYKNYILLDDICDYLDDQCNVKKETVNRNLDYIFKAKVPSLTLSQLLLKVLFSKPKKIDCTSLLDNANVDGLGNIWGCCPEWIEIPFGNILFDKDVYETYYTRLIRLSCLNKTFCFCDLRKCKYYGAKELEGYTPEKLETPKYPDQFTISTDKTCNLRCNSCRKNYYNPCTMEKVIGDVVTDKLIEQGLLEKSILLMAGQGEVFLSKNYLKMIESIKHGKDIRLMTNGVLLSEKKWKIIEGRFDHISVSVSIDAATPKTYFKLRHGPFDVLVKNLEMIGKKRKEGKVSYYTFNFVVQKENMHEMVDFVKLAKKCNVDKVQFTRLNDWGTYTKDEYQDKCLIIGNHITKELYEILKDPIFEDPIVDIDFLKIFIENSREIYDK